MFCYITSKQIIYDYRVPIVLKDILERKILLGYRIFFTDTLSYLGKQAANVLRELKKIYRFIVVVDYENEKKDYLEQSTLIITYDEKEQAFYEGKEVINTLNYFVHE